MPTLNRTPYGFTLIETILYLGLFTLLIGGIIASTYPLFTNTDRMHVRTLRETEVFFITQKIRAALHTLVTDEGVTIDTPTPGETAHTLVVKRGATELLRIEEDHSFTHCNPPQICTTLIWSTNGTPLLPLHTARVSIDSFVVTHTAPDNGEPRMLDITITADGETVGPLRYYLHF